MEKMLLLLFVLACLAQAATLGPLSCAPTTVAPGQTVTCAGVLGGGSLPSALQGSLVTSSPTGPITILASGTAFSAGKTTSVVGNNWLVSGMNPNTIADGTVITFSFPTLLTTPAGTFTISFASTFASSPTGAAIAVTVNPPQSISVSSVVSANACDLNGDGLVNSLDYDRARSNLLSRPQISNFGAAPPTIMDVQIVSNALNGGTCTVTPPPPPPPPPPPALLTLTGFSCAPQAISGAAGGNATCTATLGSQAPAGGASVGISSTADILIPPTLLIPANAASGSFTFAIGAGFGPRPAPITATYNGVSKTAPFTVQ